MIPRNATCDVLMAAEHLRKIQAVVREKATVFYLLLQDLDQMSVIFNIGGGVRGYAIEEDDVQLHPFP